MSSSGAHDWIGQTLAERYHVTGKLGAGGMGTVFKAADTRLDAEVVVKAPHPVMIKDAEFAARFKREIQSLVKLSHPNIVKVMDVGEHGGLPFVVMQYLGGGSLENRPRPCKPEEVAAWLPDAAAALDFMHSEGLIHRDIKPANILFDFSGRAYLGDFGIAKVVVEGEESDEKLTGTGALIGTAEYMAPEMLVPSAFTETYDQRADQYSLAVTVYEMLSGRTPFRGDSMAEVAVLLATKSATLLHERNAVIPEAVSHAVAVALRKKPEKRYESCQAFSGAFCAAASGEQAPSVAAASSQQQRAAGASSSGRRQVTQVGTRGDTPATPRRPTMQESAPIPRSRRTMQEDSPVVPGTRPDRGETVQQKRPSAMPQAKIIRCECGVSVRVPQDRASRTLRCPKCNAELDTPPPSPPTPPTPPPELDARKLSPGRDGVLCPICQTRVADGEPCVACPECEQSHHRDCWVEIGGCSTYGCTKAPTADSDGSAIPAHTAWGDNKQCPACGETIKSIALRCRYCGTDFENVDPMQLRDLHRQANRDESLKSVRQSAVALFVVSLVGCLAPLMLIISLCVVIPKHKQLVKCGPLFAVMAWASVAISGIWSFILLVVGISS